MNAEQFRLAVKMWHQGHLVTKIAAKVGVKVKHIHKAAASDRVNFPYRKPVKSRWRPAAVEIAAQKSTPPANVMRFTTSTGYVCTMPRISILEGSA